MLKKIAAALLAAMMALSLTACSGGDEKQESYTGKAYESEILTPGLSLIHICSADPAGSPDQPDLLHRADPGLHQQPDLHHYRYEASQDVPRSLGKEPVQGSHSCLQHPDDHHLHRHPDPGILHAVSYTHLLEMQGPGDAVTSILPAGIRLGRESASLVRAVEGRPQGPPTPG